MREQISDKKLRETAFIRGELNMWSWHIFSNNLGQFLNKRLWYILEWELFKISKVTGVYDKMQNSLAFCFIVTLRDYNLRSYFWEELFYKPGIFKKVFFRLSILLSLYFPKETLLPKLTTNELLFIQGNLK